MADEIKTADPQLVINGRIVKPAPPRMKVWREFAAFDEKDTEKLTMTEILDEHIRLIVLAFGREEITKETVDDALDLSDIIPLTMELRKWLQSQVLAKLAQLPNAAAGTD